MAERGGAHEGARQLTGRVAAALVWAAGCAGYESTSAPLRRALDAGARDAAVKGLNEALGAREAGDTRFLAGPDAPLVLLERGTVLMAEGRYDLASRDFQAADADLEVLDLDGDEVASVMKYLWSDDVANYRAPAYEKALVNTLNMLNYLARDGLSGARVEARRLTVVERHLLDHEEERGGLALGSYLAGFTFERSGRPDAAMRHYADCRERGGVPTLDEAIAGLHARSGAWDPRLGPRPAQSPAPPAAAAGADAEILVVVGTGRAPYKAPKRVPLGLGVAYLTTPTCAPHCLTAAQQAEANRIAAKGLTTWLNYPELRPSHARITGVAVTVDGRPAPGGPALDVEAQARAAFARGQGMVLLAAVTRALTRAAAGAGTDTLVRGAAGDKKGGDLLGTLAGMAVEGIMVAADVPDTRSWTALPGRVHLFRVRVPGGARSVRIHLSGVESGEVVREVRVAPGGYAVVPHLTLR